MSATFAQSSAITATSIKASDCASTPRVCPTCETCSSCSDNTWIILAAGAGFAAGLVAMCFVLVLIQKYQRIMRKRRRGHDRLSNTDTTLMFGFDIPSMRSSIYASGRSTGRSCEGTQASGRQAISLREVYVPPEEALNMQLFDDKDSPQAQQQQGRKESLTVESAGPASGGPRYSPSTDPKALVEPAPGEIPSHPPPLVRQSHSDSGDLVSISPDKKPLHHAPDVLLQPPTDLALHTDVASMGSRGKNDSQEYNSFPSQLTDSFQHVAGTPTSLFCNTSMSSVESTKSPIVPQPRYTPLASMSRPPSETRNLPAGVGSSIGGTREAPPRLTRRASQLDQFAPPGSVVPDMTDRAPTSSATASPLHFTESGRPSAGDNNDDDVDGNDDTFNIGVASAFHRSGAVPATEAHLPPGTEPVLRTNIGHRQHSLQEKAAMVAGHKDAQFLAQRGHSQPIISVRLSGMAASAAATYNAEANMKPSLSGLHRFDTSGRFSNDAGSGGGARTIGIPGEAAPRSSGPPTSIPAEMLSQTTSSRGVDPGTREESPQTARTQSRLIEGERTTYLSVLKELTARDLIS